jgi:hypothetical protein
MEKVYVIIKGWGAYSDRCTQPARVYLDRNLAEQTMAKLEAVQKKYEPHPFYAEPKPGAKEAAVKEYADLGFEADCYDDWELAETELDDRDDGQSPRTPL